MNSSEIETRDREGMTSLHIAAASYSVDAVTALLANGAFLEAENSYDPAPLHRASKSGNAEAVQALLAASADPEVPNDLGHAPLVVSRIKAKSWKYCRKQAATQQEIQNQPVQSVRAGAFFRKIAGIWKR